MMNRAISALILAVLTAFAGVAEVPETAQAFDLFRIDVEQVVLTALNDAKDALVISSWRPGRGLARTTRT